MATEGKDAFFYLIIGCLILRHIFLTAGQMGMQLHLSCLFRFMLTIVRIESRLQQPCMGPALVSFEVVTL